MSSSGPGGPECIGDGGVCRPYERMGSDSILVYNVYIKIIIIILE